MGHRLFVGCPVPDEVAQALAQWARGAFEGTAVRLTRPEQMHVTLLFYPDASPEKRDVLVSLTQQVAWTSFQVRTGLARAYGRSAIAINLETRDSERAALQDRLLWSKTGMPGPGDFVIEPLGQMVLEQGRPETTVRRRSGPIGEGLKLHVTVARRTGDHPAAVLAAPRIDFQLDRLVLYESHPSSTGARYEVISEARKGPGDLRPDPFRR